MNDPQNIPWKRIFVEAAAIVASIILAFAIVAWWQNRQTRIEEQEVLVGLRAEFVTNRGILSRELAADLRTVKSIEEFLELVENGQSEYAESIVIAVLTEMQRPGTTELGTDALNALINSGRVENLASRKLRKLLTAWSGVIGEVWDDQANYAKVVHEINIPYFAQENYSRYSLERSSEDTDTIDRLFSDATFLYLVELSLGYKKQTTGDFERAITAAAEIVNEIDNSIN